ncbi:MAG: hypothetical protein JW940_30355 [Polyangiaceae bacterium]|nr:hypothetical protein [Polyangiaceae bacterium]
MSEHPLLSLLYAEGQAVAGPSVRHPASCAAVFVGMAFGLLGCSETSASQLLTSLTASDRIAFVCRNADTGDGAELDECPDRADDGVAHSLLALVTQTLTGEIAVLDLSRGQMLDADPATPGPGFLPVGGSPTDVVATPGGIASFVSVAEAGREALFALPTHCIGSPKKGDVRRELTSWSACSLPAAPGRLQVVADPPNTDGTLRASCSGELVAEPAAAGRACAADLRLEAAVEPQGRRVLAVALPGLGELAFIDAQWLLDRDPGSFEPCRIERRVKLAVSLPPAGIDQPLPSELIATRCGQPSVAHYATGTTVPEAQPAGMAQSMGRLYVADRSAPVVHVVDVTDPCVPREEPPLLAVSFESPTETVTTRDVAVSPTTSQGQRFLYAIDDRHGSLMTFELTAGAERTPLIHPQAARLPYDPPDRIAFAAPVRGIEFVSRDMPLLDETTGVAVIGQQCDPLPGSHSPGTLYRPSADFSRGARPRRLRGVFAMAALANGQISVIDIEDDDAPCRRPIEANPDDVPDQHGCFADPADVEQFATSGGKPTVTGEVTCEAIMPHTARSANLLVSSSKVGVHAPALRALPRLVTPDGVLATGRTEDGVKHPAMLAVPFDGSEPSVLNVGTTMYSTETGVGETLVTDPKLAELPSLLLPTRQPRAYVSSETFAATFEGPLSAERTTGRLQVDQGVFIDVDAFFCSQGVQDEQLAAEMGADFGVPEAEDERAQFAKVYADYVQLTADFDEDDPYWDSKAGKACRGGRGLEGCQAKFGTADEPTTARDLAIVTAFDDRLSVVPRDPLSEAEKATRLEQIRCCFPTLTSYVVRGGRQWIFKGTVSGFRHTITKDWSGACVRECNGRKALFRGRALEISSRVPCEATDATTCGIGSAEETDFACIVDKNEGAVNPASDHVADACVFENLNARFAIYRGQQPSRRDMQFNWDVSGGFVPLSMSVATASTGSSVLPQSIRYLSRSDRLVVVDGISAGVTLFDMDQLQSVGNPYL